VAEFLVGAPIVSGAGTIAVKTTHQFQPVFGQREKRMIITRYLASSIFKGSVMVLITLVSLSLFFTMIQQLDNLGRGQFGGAQFALYILMLAPGMAVKFLPLSVLLGSMLSLGSLASNSELIAMQASGLSMRRFVSIGAQAAFILAIFAFCIDNFVVPYSETTAREIKAANLASRASLQSKRGVWIRDGRNIIFIQQLFPNGNAKNIEIYHLDKNDRLQSKIFARKAISQKTGWQLYQVKKTLISVEGITQKSLKQEMYAGNLSDQLLQSLVVDSRKMSAMDLYGYINFLQENKLNHSAESLSFWRKIYYPLTIMVMAIMAIPFVTGSQRNSNTGQRLIIGIILGLSYTILDNLLIQLGEQLELPAMLNALLPTFIFIILTLYLIRRKLLNQ
jgi:lipopolysaccharide export system permease protein